MRHKKHPVICALGSQRGSDKFDFAACPQLSQARIRDGMKNPSTQSKSAWDGYIQRFDAALFASGTAAKLLQMPISILCRFAPAMCDESWVSQSVLWMDRYG